MIEEFKKINNLRQQRKYLDKLAIQIKKMEMNETLMKDILEFDAYLENNHYYNIYEGLFEDVVVKANMYQLERKNNQLKKELSSSQIIKLEEICKEAFHYDKAIECICYDRNKKEIQSVLIQSNTLPDLDLLKKSHIQSEYAMIQAFIQNGSIVLKKGLRTLKKYTSLS